MTITDLFRSMNICEEDEILQKIIAHLNYDSKFFTVISDKMFNNHILDDSANVMSKKNRQEMHLIWRQNSSRKDLKLSFNYRSWYEILWKVHYLSMSIVNSDQIASISVQDVSGYETYNDHIICVISNSNQYFSPLFEKIQFFSPAFSLSLLLLSTYSHFWKMLPNFRNSILKASRWPNCKYHIKCPSDVYFHLAHRIFSFSCCLLTDPIQLRHKWQQKFFFLTTRSLVFT